jgi:hypothetical protein
LKIDFRADRDFDDPWPPVPALVHVLLEELDVVFPCFGSEQHAQIGKSISEVLWRAYLLRVDDAYHPDFLEVRIVLEQVLEVHGID